VAEAAMPVAGTNGDSESESPTGEATKEVLFEDDDPSLMQPRAPIVTVMGHVDHGKTSLLDAMRSTTVAAAERGGITQHIGASEVTKDGKRVVFLDTPGHEAFTAMRARGARVTDIAIVVVAADDGVMPQTLEAISHAKAAKVPIVIALNKIDKPDSNPDRVKTELAEAGVVVEEFGGDTPLVPVSAKARTGLDDLLEMVLLVADLQELKANPKRSAIGTIVEAQLDKGRGPVATALVQTGTLKVGDIIVVGETFGRVRALENDLGKRVTKAGPASAVVVLGLSEVPEAGDILRVVSDEKEARASVEARRAALASRGGEGSGRATLEDLYRQIQAGQAKELRVILKADVSGSLGAITHALGQLNEDDIRINVLHEGAGDITDNDIMLASASNAIIVGFNTKITDTARRAAESEGVDVRLYDIIYKLTDDIEAALKGLLEPEIVEVVEGRAEVRQVIRVGKNTVIAGSFVTDGRIVRGGARIWRGGKIIATDRIDSLRRFRDDVREVLANFECGIGLANFHDIAEGDIIECFTTQTVSRVATG
jgi:translation initiation factor IF-2